MKVTFLIRDFVVEPLGIAYVSAVLKQHGHDVDLVKVKNKSVGDLAYEITALGKVDVLAYSVTTGTHKYYLDLNLRLKAFSVFDKTVSVFGGAHPTYFVDMKDEAGVDFIIRGEAERSFPRLLEQLKKGENPKVETCLVLAPLIQDLDSLPFPDRALLYKFPENRDNPIKNVITTRGCPFSCNYCYNSLYKEMYKGQKFVRHRSPESVVGECIELKKYPLQLIWFEDDEFIIGRKRFLSLMRMYKSYVDVPFHCQVRIESLDEEIVKVLKKSGCRSVTFAVESGSWDIRYNLLKRRISRDQIFNGVRLLKKYKIPFRLQNMIGLPTETWKQVLETLDLTISCKPTIGWVSIFQPYPSLSLGEKCKEMGLWDGEVDEFSPSFFEKTVLKLPKMTRRRLNNMAKIFALVVKFPLLRPWVYLLTSLPENRLYGLIYKKLKAYLYDYKLYGVK